jgi:hypothetical protein
MISTRMSRFVSHAAFGFGLALLGCGAEFDRVSEIQTLRVLGVEKSSPYAQPGETVNFSLAFHDGATQGGEDRRTIQVAWIGGCFNPPGDLYAGCFATEGFGSSFAFGNEFALPVPDDVIVPRQPPMLPYGLSYVFFAVCAGSLALDASGAAGLPIRCKDADGRDLGSSDFVVGYTAIYVFGTNAAGEPYANQNPAVTGLSVAGQELSVRSEDVPGGNACLGPDCLAECADPAVGCVNPEPSDIDCNQPGAPCFRVCPEDGDAEQCDPIAIRPLIDQSDRAEIDAISRDVYGTEYQEQMWINYYVTGGSVRSDTRLLNDATQGWNTDFGTDFFAPSVPGPVQLWAVAHDNRGGMTWVGGTIKIVDALP